MLRVRGDRSADPEDVPGKSREVPPPKHGMVDWYDPLQLLSTGIEVLISEAMGRRFDYRMMEDVALKQKVFDYSRDGKQERQEIWFDFLADTGDGWNSTYAIASLVAQPALQVGDRSLPRGRFLILGGDEVYPFASQRNYRERLVAPFETALETSEAPHPHLFAIPGNHDWYDGLVSFSRRFTQRRWFGGWRTRQRRSYFALKLPHRWWLWAVDVQLESDIDIGQLNYFRRIARKLEPGDRVILVSARPEWLYKDIEDDPVAESNLAYLEKEIIEPKKADVYLWLAGDLHHYRRHEDRKDARFQRLTSGGGGAYLFPTHGPLFGAANTVSRRRVRVGDTDFEPKCRFPSPATSFRLSLLNLFFLIKNWKFGFLTGLTYAALTWGQPAAAGGGSIWPDVLAHPSRLVWMLLILVAFILYADRERPVFRFVGGAGHGALHIAAALLIADWTARHVHGSTATVEQAWRLASNFLGGAILGPTIVGLYLLVAVNLFGAHSNEAFSSLRIQDFKNFLRLHITPEGTLEILPIGINRVPRRNDAQGRYTLIEGPITIDPRSPAAIP